MDIYCAPVFLLWQLPYPGNSSKDRVDDIFVFYTFSKSCYSYGLMLQKCVGPVQEISMIRPYMTATQLLDWLNKHFWAFFIATDDVRDFSFNPDRQCSCNEVEIAVSLSFPLAHINSFFLYGITSMFFLNTVLIWIFSMFLKFFVDVKLRCRAWFLQNAQKLCWLCQNLPGLIFCSIKCK